MMTVCIQSVQRRRAGSALQAGHIGIRARLYTIRRGNSTLAGAQIHTVDLAQCTRGSAKAFWANRPKEGQMNPNTTQAHWPVIDNVITPLAEWWRRHAIMKENVTDIDALGPEEMARMAQDIGIAPGDLRELAHHCSDAADLLEKRLGALGLTSAALVKTAPAELRDMERLCTLCQTKGRCARDLAADPDDPAWRQYCLNEQTLVSLAHAGIER
jgi:hypothetical protein